MHRKLLSRIAVVVLLTIYSAALFAASPGVVDMKEDKQTVTLDNGQVKVVFSKAGCSVKSMVYQGREVLAPGGGYIQIAFTSRSDSPGNKWDYQLVRHEPGLVEIAFKNTDPKCALDLGSHFIVRADDPGFYNYLTFGHDAARSPGAYKMAQFNYCMRIDPTFFTTAAVDDQRIKPFPPTTLLVPERQVMDSTYLLPDGSYYSKYFYSAQMDEKHIVHGAMGNGMGIWIVMPSHEHLNAGPEHQELTVHQAGASAVLLAHATAAHYGAGILTTDAKDGSWSKVSAPWFIYVNSGKNQEAMWSDAKARAQKEVDQWPYKWLNDAEFQLHRGSASGRVIFDDHKPADGARVILAEHEENPSPLLWQQQWRGYRFYGWADKDGRFTIGKVRPGLYDVYAWKSGVFGQTVKCAVRVDAGSSADAGDVIWTQPHGRETLWQIGTPDRTAAEFGFAENFRQWGLWKQIAEATPDGVNFVVGKSQDRDWPFEMAGAQNSDLSWKMPVWRVRFDNTSARTGQAVLTFGVAAYEGSQKPQLKVSLNGEPIGAVQDLEINGAAHRSSIHAAYQQRDITFDAAKLKPGANILTIEMPSPGKSTDKPMGVPAGALLWDAIRLELEK